MKKMKKGIFAMLIGCSLLAAAASAAERKPLPDFEVANKAGEMVKSSSLSQGGHWLLIYAEKECAVCPSIFSGLQSDETLPMSRVVIVIKGAAAGQMEALVKSYPRLKDATLLLDKDGAAGNVMKLKGSPVIIGIDEGTVQWKIAGILSSQPSQKSVVSSWIK